MENELKLRLRRDITRGICPFGKLSIDGKFICFTQEEIEIPKGKYRVLLTKSVRYNKILPLICNVPGYDGIRIMGDILNVNTNRILVSKSKTQDLIDSCDEAFKELFNIIDEHRGIVTIEIL